MIEGELEPGQECVMGMDRRLRHGSKQLRNQCQGTGVQAQVYRTLKKNLYREGQRNGERSRNREKTNPDHSFPLSQLKTPFSSGLVFNLPVNDEGSRDRAVTPSRQGALLPSLPALLRWSSTAGHRARYGDISRTNKLI